MGDGEVVLKKVTKSYHGMDFEGEEIRDYLRVVWQQMKETIQEGLNTDGLLPGPLRVERKAKKLFDEVAPKYADRSGGYTQIFKLGPRRGDGAEMALIRLMDGKAAE